MHTAVYQKLVSEAPRGSILNSYLSRSTAALNWIVQSTATLTNLTLNGRVPSQASRKIMYLSDDQCGVLTSKCLCFEELLLLKLCSQSRM